MIFCHVFTCSVPVKGACAHAGIETKIWKAPFLRKQKLKKITWLSSCPRVGNSYGGERKKLSQSHACQGYLNLIFFFFFFFFF